MWGGGGGGLRRRLQAEGAGRTKTLRENLAKSRSQALEVSMARELTGKSKKGWNESWKVRMASIMQIYVGHGKKFGFNSNFKWKAMGNFT